MIVISSEMPELLGICDRIYVMNEGRFVVSSRARKRRRKRSWPRSCGGRTPDMSSETMTASGGSSGSYLNHLKHNIREYGMLLSLIAIMIFFQFQTEGRPSSPTT